MQVENTDILLKDVRNNFDKIYVMYYSRMFRFAKEYVLFDEDAENIVQDVSSCYGRRERCWIYR